MTQLSTQPYKGMRDYYPADKRSQNYIFDTWRRVVELHGYEEYGAPMIEPLELYAAKTGQEIVNEQTYQFTDRGGRNVAIRPEMTPSLARMVAARQHEIAYPARWYSIANYMRYERPQAGREREFWQLNADIFGDDSVNADAEIVLLADEIMKAFGAKSKMYQIKVNDRRLINFVMAEYLELDVMQLSLMVKLFDKKDKISHVEFRDAAADIFGEEAARRGLKKIAALLSAKTMAELPAEVRDCAAVHEVRAFFTILHEAGIANAKFDITLMRGFDYYNGIVFEVFDTHPDNNRSMFGGGRYDGLVGLFGGKPLAAVGMAPGATTLEAFLRAHKLLPELKSTTELYLICLTENTKDAAKLATALRAEGVRVEFDAGGRKIDKRIKTALKKDIPYVLFVGDTELSEAHFTLKNLKTQKEEKLSFERIVAAVKDPRGDDDIDIV